ncbi:MAG: hypothetical protein QOE68_484 [Thermoanaerobaculia bacterium]|nr:hypothetical protein [Thermoanaerobaculia bacterium]
MIAVIALLAQLAGAAPCPPPAISEGSVSDWRRNIALVSSPHGNGAGLVVGWTQGDGEAWIAVPAHVVFGDELPKNAASYATGLQVRLPNDRKPRELCMVSGGTNPRPPLQGVDLTFVCVEWLGSPLFGSALPVREIHNGDELRLLRPNSGGDARGTVIGLADDGRGGDVQTSVKGVASESGTPVASPAGIIGLFLGPDPQVSGRVLSMRAIKDKAFGKSAVPWQLVESEFFDCSHTRRVCVNVERGVTPPAIRLRNLFRDGEASLRTGGCVDLPEGKYETLSSGSTACEPRTIRVYAGAAPMQVKLECTPVLTGTWHTAGGDWLICNDNTFGTANCSGLNSLQNGLLEAAFSANGTRVSVTGSFTSPLGTQRSATGTLMWTAGRLKGQIRTGDARPQPVELMREESQ